MQTDARLLELFSYYRDAELRGAALLLRLIKFMRDDADAQVKLTLHAAQEAHHAWLWTKRIVDIGGRPLSITDGYQARIGMRVMPHGVPDLLGLTLVVEARSLERYRAHAARDDVDDATRAILRTVTSDEKWHLAWIEQQLGRMTAGDPEARRRAEHMARRYAEIEEEAYWELLARERVVFGVDQEKPA